MKKRNLIFFFEALLDILKNTVETNKNLDSKIKNEIFRNLKKSEQNTKFVPHSYNVHNAHFDFDGSWLLSKYMLEDYYLPKIFMHSYLLEFSSQYFYITENFDSLVFIMRDFFIQLKERLKEEIVEFDSGICLIREKSSVFYYSENFETFIEGTIYQRWGFELCKEEKEILFTFMKNEGLLDSSNHVVLITNREGKLSPYKIYNFLEKKFSNKKIKNEINKY